MVVALKSCQIVNEAMLEILACYTQTVAIKIFNQSLLFTLNKQQLLGIISRTKVLLRNKQSALLLKTNSTRKTVQYV